LLCSFVVFLFGGLNCPCHSSSSPCSRNPPGQVCAKIKSPADSGSWLNTFKKGSANPAEIGTFDNGCLTRDDSSLSMKLRPLPPKPIWYQYAQQIRKELDNVKATKSGKRGDRLILFSWKTAAFEKEYPGS